ncbi:MAG: ribonuclease III [Acidobacteriota bacterium]|nr:ribonuclease III [Acidobacteriota bacterium]
MEDIERRIGYKFKKKELLGQALTHSSYGYENSSPHNERLEFLGDSILGYVISRELFLRFQADHEGTLSKLKSVLVSAQSLAEKARELELGEHLRLGRGEAKAGGKNKQSILADAMESLFGALSLDGGFQAAEDLIMKLYGEDIRNATIDIKNSVDFKTLLQERLQERALGLPRYHVIKEEGPAHNRRFVVCIVVGDYEGPVGTGTSKKGAQQECARLLLEDDAFWEAHTR